MSDRQEYRNKKSIIYLIFENLKKGNQSLTGLREKINLQHYALQDYLEIIRFIQDQPRLICLEVGRMEILALDKSDNMHQIKTINPTNPQITSQSFPLDSHKKKTTCASQNDYSFKIISQFKSEFISRLRKMNWKVSKDAISNIADILYNTWINMDTELKDSPEFPPDSFSKIIGKLTIIPEEIQDSDKSKIEDIIQSCWDIFNL